MKKRLNFNNGFLNFATIVCLMYVLFMILNLAVGAIVSHNFDASALKILSLAVDILFYCLVAFYFYRAKGGASGSALYAMLSLAICTYLLPTILTLIEGIAHGDLYRIIPIFSSLGVGIAYSIILIINSRNPKKGLMIAMFVLGIILFGLAFYQFFVENGSVVEAIGNALLNSRIDLFFQYLITFIYNFFSFGFAIIFMLYPVYAMKSY